MLGTREVYNVSTDLEPRDWRFSLIDYALHGLLPDDPKEAASIRRRSLRFYYDPTLKTLYTVVHMTVSSSVALLIQRHNKCLKKPTMVYTELISQVQSSKTDYIGSDIIGQL